MIAQGKQEKLPQKTALSGKTQIIQKFAKTQGILCAEVLNSLILKIKDIAIFATKSPNSFVRSECVC